MIRVEIHAVDGSMLAEFPMPFAPRINDNIDLKDGKTWLVTGVTWVVDPIMQDPYGGQIYKLLVEVI